MEINLIAETLKFLLLGMSTVFLFLMLLVFVTHWQGKIVSKYFSLEKEVLKQSPSLAVKSSRNTNTEVAAAIAVSLHIHQNSKRAKSNG